VRAFLGLGSNLGDRMAYLRDAVAALPDVVAKSSVYETEPIGGPAGQSSYLNLVVELDTRLLPTELLAVCRHLESTAGRIRAEVNGPRCLDVDVLLVGDQVVRTRELVVPHPRMRERRFVLAPLAELEPALVADWLLAAADGKVTRVGTL